MHRRMCHGLDGACEEVAKVGGSAALSLVSYVRTEPLCVCGVSCAEWHIGVYGRLCRSGGRARVGIKTHRIGVDNRFLVF
jgi:hypothetical protein